jgi:oligosaccharyltransferase complex subunit alpha (ribophorin I)
MRLFPSLSILLLTALTPTSASPAPLQNFINTAIARTIELGGATTSTTTQYNVKTQNDSPGMYHLALANDGEDIPAWWEVQVGGKVVEGLIPLLVSGLVSFSRIYD